MEFWLQTSMSSPEGKDFRLTPCPTMDDFERCFDVHDQFHIIVCVSCQFAVVPSQIKEHLRKHHACLSSEQRSRIVERVNALPTLAPDEGSVVYPPPSHALIDHLPIFFDGVKCLGQSASGRLCAYVCRTVYGMQEHCRNAHSWVNKRKRGGDVSSSQAKMSNQMWEKNRACQRFFKVGKWQRYFEVTVGCAQERTETSERHKHAFFRKLDKDMGQADRDAADEANRVQGFDEHRSTVVPWLRETGVVDHLRGLKKDEIRAAIALPPSDEGGYLRKVVKATEDLLRDAHQRCFDGPECMLTWPCRVVLNRFQSSQVEATGSTRAFDPHKDAGSLKAYFRVAQQILVYFDRVAASEDYFFSHEPDEESVLLEERLKPTDEQLAVWGAIRRLAQEEATSESGDNDHRLRDRLLDFWMLLISHETGSRRYESPLLSFCALLSIKPSTHGWMEPGNFNSHLSAMIWVFQLLIFYDSARKEQRGEGQTLALVKRCCERYLQQTVEAPMGEILCWRLLLFRVSKDCVGDHEASWDENEQVLTYEDTELHMHQVPTLLLSEYRLCQQLLYDDLMLGQKDVRPMHSWTLRDGPDVDTVGWTFTQHRDNAPLLQGWDRALLAAIERSQPLCRLFLVDDRRSPRGLAWRDAALAAYESTVQAFLQRLAVLIHVSGGQPVRESEFFSMTWRNTQRRRSITLRHDRVRCT